MSSSEPVAVHVLDREYTVGVEPGERDSLMAAAKLLDGKMREIRGNNRMAALDRVAVLAALNLAYALAQRPAVATVACAPGTATGHSTDVGALIQRIDQALGVDGQLL